MKASRRWTLSLATLLVVLLCLGGAGAAGSQSQLSLNDRFEDGAASLAPWKPSGPGTVGVVVDPHDSGNNVLKVEKAVEGGFNVGRHFETLPNADRTLVSLKFMVSDFAPGGAFNMHFGAAMQQATRSFGLIIGKQNDVHFIACRPTEQGFGTRVSAIVPNVWYKLDVEYKPAGKEDTELIFHLDGEQKLVLDEYFHGGDSEKLPVKDVTHIDFYAFKSVVATLYVDDITVEAVRD